MADVVEPDDLAVGRVEERDVQAVEVEAGDGRVGAAGVSLRLDEDVLRAERDLLCFDDAQQASIDNEGVVGGMWRSTPNYKTRENLMSLATTSCCSAIQTAR